MVVEEKEVMMKRKGERLLGETLPEKM